MTQSYFEYLGRKDAAPFTAEELDYERTEADLSEAVNKQIDANIKDRDQFFQDNINLYNKTMGPEKFKKNLQGLYNLTVTGKQFLDERQTFLEHRTTLNSLKETYKDKARVSEYARVAKNEEIADNELKTEEDSDLTLLARDGKDRAGDSYTPKQILNFKELLTQREHANAKHAAKNMQSYYGRYLTLAKDTLVVNGKLYKDMTVDEKDEWFDVATGNFIGMFIQANPGITEGHLITHFMPTYSTTQASWTGQNLNVANSATDTLLQNSDYQNTWNALNLAGEHANNPSLGEPIISSAFSSTGWVNNRTDYHRNIGTLNPRKAAMADFQKMVEEGIDKGQLTEEAITHLLEGDLFVADQHKNSGKKSNLYDINQDVAISIANAWDTQVKKENRDREIQQYKMLTEIVNAGGELPVDTISGFTNEDIIEKVNALITKSNLVEFDEKKNANFKVVQDYYQNISRGRVFNTEVFDPKQYDYNDIQWVESTYGHIYREAGEFFNKEYKRLIRFSDEASAIAEAKRLTDIAMTQGQFDPKDPVTMDAKKLRTAENLFRIYDANPKEAINSEVVLEGEEDPLLNAEDYLAGKTDELDHTWTSLARLFPKKNPIKLAHDRLVKLGRIKPMPGLMGDFKGVLSSPLLNHKNHATNTLLATEGNDDVTGAPRLEAMLDRLRTPESTKNGGVNAIKDPEGNWVTELPLGKPLSEHTVAEVMDLVAQGYTNLGAFDMTASGFSQIIKDNFENIETTDLFDEKKQIKFLLARLRYKANNQHLFGNADNTYRRLKKFKEKDIEEFETLFENLPTFLKLETLFGPAAEEFINQTLPE